MLCHVWDQVVKTNGLIFTEVKKTLINVSLIPTSTILNNVSNALPQPSCLHDVILYCLLISLSELKRIFSEFVPRVSNTLIRELLDDLHQQKVFSTEEKDFVMENHKCRADQARYLINEVIKKGERASQILIDSMKKRDTYLCSTLGLISSPGELLNVLFTFCTFFCFDKMSFFVL